MLGTFSAKVGVTWLYWGILGMAYVPPELQDITGTPECFQLAAVVRSMNPDRDLTGTVFCIKERVNTLRRKIDEVS